MAKQETRAEFYKRNASEGRTARFDLTLDTSHVPDEDAKRVGCGQFKAKISQGTLTPEHAKLMQSIVYGHPILRDVDAAMVGARAVLAFIAEKAEAADEPDSTMSCEEAENEAITEISDAGRLRAVVEEALRVHVERHASKDDG